MSMINVVQWSIEDVGNWVSGLDISLNSYRPQFFEKGVNGTKLLNFMAGDLERIGISRVGDQILLHEAIQCLRNVSLGSGWWTSHRSTSYCLKCYAVTQSGALYYLLLKSELFF